MNQNIKESGNLSPDRRKKHFYVIVRNYGLICLEESYWMLMAKL